MVSLHFTYSNLIIIYLQQQIASLQELVDSGNLSFRFGGRVLLNGSKMKHSMLDKQSDTIIIMSRKHYGLPENKLVLACFNSMFKYTKEMWMCWMKVAWLNINYSLYPDTLHAFLCTRFWRNSHRSTMDLL